MPRLPIGLPRWRTKVGRTGNKPFIGGIMSITEVRKLLQQFPYPHSYDERAKARGSDRASYGWGVADALEDLDAWLEGLKIDAKS